MIKQEYKTRCGQLRRVIRDSRTTQAGPFRKTTLHGMTYIYNALSRNVIYKYRLGSNGNMGAQYRPTSLYRPVLERITQDNAPARIVASPNMVRHVRDVRSAIGVQ